MMNNYSMYYLRSTSVLPLMNTFFSLIFATSMPSVENIFDKDAADNSK